MQGKKMEMT